MAVETLLASNSFRLDKFATRTSLGEIDGKKFVYKSAITDEAKPFLEQTMASERKNAEYLKGRFEVLCGTLKGDRIEYEYLPYQSLTAEIAAALCRGDYHGANELFQDYVKRLRSLPRELVVPKEFFVAITGNANFSNQKMDCLSRGVLDLIPRNILVNGERWIVIDNEWSFDFPVPIAFVLFRAIRGLAISLQIDIRKATCMANPAIGMFNLGFSTYYVPVSWAEYIGDDHMVISQMHQWEMEFQRYLLGGEIDRSNSVKIKPKTRTHFGKVSILISMLKKRTGSWPVIRRLLDMLHRIAF